MKQIPKEPSQKLHELWFQQLGSVGAAADAVAMVWCYVCGCFDKSSVVLLFSHPPRPRREGGDPWHPSLLWWHLGAPKAEVIFLRPSAGWWQCLDLNPCLLVSGRPGS